MARISRAVSDIPGFSSHIGIADWVNIKANENLLMGRGFTFLGR